MLIKALRKTRLINRPLVERLLKPCNVRDLAKGQRVRIGSANWVSSVYVEIVLLDQSEEWRTAWALSSDWDWRDALNPQAPQGDHSKLPVTSPLIPDRKMPFITANKTTWVKSSPEQSTVLLERQEQSPDLLLFKVKNGQKFAVLEGLDDVKGHALIELAGPLTVSGQKWTEAYVYMADWDGFTALKKAKQAEAAIFSPAGQGLLLHPGHYFVQNDNKDWKDDGSASNLRHGPVQCGLTAAAMAIATVWPNEKVEQCKKESGTGQFEDWIAAQFKKYGLKSTSGEHHAILMGKLGIEARFTTTSTVGELKKALKTHPVVLGTYYKASGHFGTAMGYDEITGDVIFFDPYGKRKLHGSFNQWDAICQTNHDTFGKDNRYSPDVMDHIWAPHDDGFAVYMDPSTPHYGDNTEPICFDAAPSNEPATKEIAASTPPQSGGNTSTVTPIQATYLKAQPVQSSQLKPEEKDLFDESDGALECVVSKAEAGHIMITLPHDEKIKGRNVWYLFAAHVKIETPGGVSLSSPGGAITDADYERVSALIGCEARAFKAVVQVEAAGSGLFPSGRPKILFEAHWFADLTGQKYNGSHPHISSKSWNRALYIGGEKEWDRWEEAAKLDRQAAIGSASYGLGQVMGAYSWEMPAMQIPGNTDLEKAENFLELNKTESGQLEIMGRFIMADSRLIGALKQKAWAKFAHAYNGESFALNKYDQKLAEAYAQGS